MTDTKINEKSLYEKYPAILDLLLLDNTTKKNIIWATNSYEKEGYKFNDYILPVDITKNIIKPRLEKTKAEQTKRSKDSAEVFTPSWMCNKQNNLIDEAWFGMKNVFNTEMNNNDWTLNEEQVVFPEGKTWIDYIKDTRLEITCGEAPYLVSRYDTVTGNPIDTKRRIGLLDRKFRVINENSSSDNEWKQYAIEALKSIYGFEWQGDNLILARENILYSFIDYYKERFNEEPSEKLLIEVATIISWNIWQMDGIKCVIPNSCKAIKKVQKNLFGEEEVLESGCAGCAKGDAHKHTGIYSEIMDWERNKKIKFVDMLEDTK